MTPIPPMLQITGDEPFYPIYLNNGVTIRQEVILRFMVENSKSFGHNFEFLSETAQDFAYAYIKTINNDQNKQSSN